MAAAAVKRLEEALRHRGVDAGPVVDDRNLQRRRPDSPSKVLDGRGRLHDDDINRTPGRAVLDRVADEVVEDLLNPGGQRVDRR